MSLDEELYICRLNSQQQYINLGREVYNNLGIETKNLINRLPPFSIYNIFDIIEEADNILRISLASMEFLLSVETILSTRVLSYNNYAFFTEDNNYLNFVSGEGKNKIISKNYFIFKMSANSDMSVEITEKIWEVFKNYIVKGNSVYGDFFGLTFLDGKFFLKGTDR